MDWIKKMLKKLLPRNVFEVRDLYRATRPLAKRKCPICGYSGWFGTFGRPPRIDAQCKKCNSLERHRLFFVAYEKGAFNSNGSLNQPIIHFSPETPLERVLRGRYKEYRTSNLRGDADLKLNLEEIDIGESSIGTVIVNHVLEHVDDKRALKEIYRILKVGGKLVASVPIIEGWAETYENVNISSRQDRELHFGQSDHLRYFGRDFRDRVQSAGFKPGHEITAFGDEIVEYGLIPGEKIFVFEK